MFHYPPSALAGECAKRPAALRRREPAAVIAGVSLLVASAAVCVGLLAPVLWTIATEGAQPIRTYEGCGTLHDEARRLACYDDVLRRTRPGPIKNGAIPVG